MRKEVGGLAESEMDGEEGGKEEGEVSFALSVRTERERATWREERRRAYDDVIASVRDESDVERA